MSHVPDQSVDLDSIHIIKLLQSLLDLSLVRLNIHDEHQGVVLLNHLHRALGVQRVNDNLVVIEAGLMRDGFAGVFWRPGELEGLGSVEGGRRANLASFVCVGLLLNRLSIFSFPCLCEDRERIYPQ